MSEKLAKAREVAAQLQQSADYRARYLSHQSGASPSDLSTIRDGHADALAALAAIVVELCEEAATTAAQDI